MNEKKKLQPKVRFREFTGENAPDWEQRKLGEVATLINGRAYKQNELLDQGKYRVLRVGNFNTNDRWYWSNLELEDNKYANKGELLYLWATNFGPKIWEEEKVIYHYHIWKVDYLSGSLEKKYLYTWLLVDKDKIMKDTNGSTMIHITKKNMEERKISIPVFEEQKCIGQFFEKVDKLITLHQRKLEQLEQLKNTLLSKMFPKSGTNIPKIRFSGFTDTWKQRHFENIFFEFSNKSTVEDAAPLLSSTNKGMEFREGRVNSESNSGYKIINNNDLVLSPQNLWLGNINFNNLGTGIVSPSYKTFKCKNVDIDFIRPQLRNNQMMYQYKNASTQGASVVRRNLDLDLFNQIIISIPNSEEQKMIGRLFSKIDNSIAIHQRKLEQLKNLKQTLLNKMFV